METRMGAKLPTTRELLEERVLARTGRRVRDLSVEVHEEKVVLRGRAESFHVKQLAQHGVWELLPAAKLTNQIQVYEMA
jgi:hypothetical protein